METDARLLETLLESLARIDTRLVGLPRVGDSDKRVTNFHHEIRQLQTRISAQSKLVAVFGAFSAGKSSLINALVGRSLLTTSPNPTTAAITEIKFEPTGGDGFARITAKTRDELWQDVQEAFHRIHHEVADLSEAAAAAAELKPANYVSAVRPYVAFLRAFGAGFPEMMGRIGTEWRDSFDAIRRYTAEEKYACFVQQVELQQNASILESGIVLVDTPGVDSVHRRHSDVAFNYMRRADAIIFVVYYTHAFSRADKDFLLQLADVQNVIGAEKLFVVINAVDLAKSPEEQEAVRERVEQELKSLGIVHPRVYEVSSQLSFAATCLTENPADERFVRLLRQRLRLTADSSLPGLADVQQGSGIPRLVDDLDQTTQVEAARLASEATRSLLQRIKQFISDTIRLAGLSASRDATARALWAQQLQSIRLDLISGRGAQRSEQGDVEQSLRAQWKELLYHAGERIRLRHAALFREAFNPGRFAMASRVKAELDAALADFLDSVCRQVDLEARTYLLRTQQQRDAALTAWQNRLSEQFAEYGLPLQEPPVSEDVQQTVEQTLEHAQLFQGDYQKILRRFASPAQFFEGGGSREMLDELGIAVMPAVRVELAKATETAVEELLEILRSRQEATYEMAVAEIDKALTGPQEQTAEQDIHQWSDAQNVCSQCMDFRIG